MTDLLSQLSIAARSLSAQSVGVATASHNIDNASTPGYARQRAELTAALPAAMLGGAFIGQGVNVLTVSQARDRFLEAQVPGALGAAAFADAQASTLTSVRSLDPDDPLNLPTTLANFFSAVRELSRQPSDPGARRAFVTAAGQVAQTFQRSASELDGARRAVDGQLGGEAAQATDLAKNVARLNAEVRKARAGGGEPNDLLDARRKAAEDLSALTGGKLIEQDGDLNVQTGSVVLVAGDKSATFGTRAVAGNRGHLALTATGVDGAPAKVLDNAQVGGTIGGLLQARDGGLAAAEKNVDQAAFDFANQMNAVHSAGVALDGTSGHDLFTPPAAVEGAASSIAVDASVAADPSLVAASASGASGDGSQALALLAGEDATVSTVASAIDDFGAVARSALSERDASAAARDQLLSLRESASGVSIDEEMIEMTKAQRVFDAVGKVLSTADDMLKGLLELR